MLRRLINSAYRALGDLGLNFTGVDQDEEITRRRMQTGEVFVLEQEGRLIATVSVRVKETNGVPHLYVNQLAVEPAHQRRGIGGQLMVFAEDEARRRGLTSVQLDTAIPAVHLLRWYRKRGYATLGEVQWDGKLYRSIVLEKRL